MGVILSPSLMCADYENLKDEVIALEQAGADRFHLDLMDGRFVSNFAMGLTDIKTVCNLASIKTEIHLMVVEPSKHIKLFCDAGINIIYIHPESDYHPGTVLQKIVESGAEAGIVLSPGTSVESVQELLYVAKHVLIMGVNPGHAGQMYLSYVDHKIEKLLELKDRYGLEIMIDGACNEERIREWSEKGVDGFVLGTAALFNKTQSYEKIFATLRNAAKRQ